MYSNRAGSLVISLDFELMWGLVGSATKDGYGLTNVKQVPLVITRLLDLFQQYGIHATFATVGMMMYEGKERLLVDTSLCLHPSYIKSELSPYENNYIPSISPAEEGLFFQPELVRKISATDGMEIGTHTFCHYYCWEPGQTGEEFESDIKKAIEVAREKNIVIKSIVFPRNNINPAYLSICAKYGITSYRGNAMKYFNQPRNKVDALKNRICRLLDAYINLGGDTSFSYDTIDEGHLPINIRASRFVRPFSPSLRHWEWLRRRRISKEMIHAAQKGHIYHLWWHPHNFGNNIEENLAFLESILKVYHDCHIKYNMQSCTMDEIRNQLVNLKQ